MKYQLSTRAQAIKPSPTFAIATKAAQLKASGKDIISLSTGEPDFDTPDHIKAAAIKAIQEGQTKYTSVGGTIELKQAVIDKLHRDNQLDYNLEQVLISVGAKQSIYNLAQAVLNPDDEFIIPAPYWVSYKDITLLSGAKPVIIETGIEQHFKITADQLEQAITPKTRMVALISPSNPTGMLYTKEELKSLAQVLQKHPDILILSDDIYEHIIWEDEPFKNIVMVCPELYDRTIVINGVSKAYAMTGWRIGYAAGPTTIIKAMNKIQGQSTSNPCSISQAAAVAALNGDHKCIRDMAAAFKKRHDLVVKRLNKMPGVECASAQGAFFAFPKVTKLINALPGINDDIQLADDLIDKVGLALVPGSAFGGPGYIRLSFAASEEVLIDALNRFESYATEAFKAT